MSPYNAFARGAVWPPSGEPSVRIMRRHMRNSVFAAADIAESLRRAITSRRYLIDGTWRGTRGEFPQPPQRSCWLVGRLSRGKHGDGGPFGFIRGTPQWMERKIRVGRQRFQVA